MQISFFEENLSFSLKNKKKIKEWLVNVANQENYQINEINFIFCDDNYLVEINKKYLNKEYLTDTISFQYSELHEDLFGDIYISIDRVKENANIFQTSPENELHRVIIHGFLHLIGYADDSIPNKQTMTNKENTYLSIRDF